ncbi:low affinity iron permease family protein [Paludisphaera mucosa]|uniref:Low affinity iron permease family protein n=1 Tax=Paludisphaera mucosa TaxID=3030827 RepID=A0ABT6FEU0_9BACT|nr:low affinity iron permease family protein [Paludisphaera mucosa]MDG3006095.1 low affinity iron permease family protein [Paludisphaera mucosa]
MSTQKNEGNGDETKKVYSFLTRDRFEAVAERTAKFTSGPWGTHVGFGLVAFWLGASVVVGWDEAYSIVDEVTTMSSFLLLFLLQRAQAKDTLAMQVKLNELLAAVQKASPTLINLEDRSESEVQEIHDRFQEVQEKAGDCSSIDEVRRN